MLRVLDLFSGIGGFSLGLERTGGFETIAFCEIDPFCQKVLAKHWPDVPVHSDIKGLTADDIGPVDVICGGYPCQPFSLAGKRQGAEDDRHLWPEMFRLVAECRPAWVIGENVAGHINMGLDEVLSDLENEGYTARTFVIPACAVDAPHRRDRVWTIASNNDPDGHGKRPHRTEVNQHRENEPNDRKKRKPGQVCEVLAGPRNSEKRYTGTLANASRHVEGREEQRSERQRIRAGGESKPLGNAFQPGLERHTGHGDGRDQPGRIKKKPGGSTGAAGLPKSLAHPDGNNQFGRSSTLQMGRVGKPEETENNGFEERAEWLPESPVGRVANGIPRRVDRLRSLGNAVVPQIPEIIGRAIMQAEIGN